MQMRAPLTITIGIATINRPELLRVTLTMIARQTRAADRVLVAPASQADLRGIDPAALGFEVVPARQGLCAQRNAILHRACTGDMIVFFDDDFFPCRQYLAAVERAFLEEPDVVMATGTLIADGIKGPGLSVDAAGELIHGAERDSVPSRPRAWKYNGYGCNMAFRLGPVRQGIVFDERLPHYGWLEDVDFSRRMAAFGRIVQLPDARGVHLGAKSGRTSGVRLGYSQVANPLYLVAKGTLSWRRAWIQICRNVGMNLLRGFCPESYIDRRGRLRGNVLAFSDALRGAAKPENIEAIL
jgi:glycosyltransferase involved in cell wall biosynthesis